MSELTKELKERLSRYVAGKLEPAVFRDWFALLLRDVHKSNDPEAETLAHMVEWQFLSVERGTMPLDALKVNLSHLSQEQQEPNPVQFLEVPGQQNKWYSSGLTSIGMNTNSPSLA